MLGGAAVTEEFHPGFRNSTASYTVSLLHPKVIRDLKLAEHGLRIVERPVSNFLPLPDGRHLIVGGGLAATQAEVAKFSRRDADALPAYYAMLDRVADVLRDLLLATPPNVGGGAPRAARRLEGREALPRARSRRPARRARPFHQERGRRARPLVRIRSRSRRRSASTRSSATSRARTRRDRPTCSCTTCSARSTASAASWGHAIGGMGAITQAMAKECAARGVVLRTDAPVARVIVKARPRIGRRARERRGDRRRSASSPTSRRSCCSSGSSRRSTCRTISARASPATAAAPARSG